VPLSSGSIIDTGVESRNVTAAYVRDLV